MDCQADEDGRVPLPSAAGGRGSDPRGLSSLGGSGTAPRPYLTTREAADYLNVNERFIRRLVSERRVRFFHVGKFVRLSTGDLDALVTAVEPLTTDDLTTTRSTSLPCDDPILRAVTLTPPH